MNSLSYIDCFIVSKSICRDYSKLNVRGIIKMRGGSYGQEKNGKRRKEKGTCASY